jgi:DNA-binding MarR family transcriptional regulator
MESLDVLALIQLGQTFERNVNVALMYSGLRIPQYRLLEVLAERGQTTVTEMSEALRVTRATASVLINELIRSGSIDVEEHPADRRSFHIQLSEHGLYRLQSARSDLDVLIRKLTARFPREIVEAVNRLATQPHK